MGTPGTSTQALLAPDPETGSTPQSRGVTHVQSWPGAASPGPETEPRGSRAASLQSIDIPANPGDIGAGGPLYRNQRSASSGGIEEADALETQVREVSLVDLTNRLRELGVEGDYLRYRRQYRKWRARTATDRRNLRTGEDGAGEAADPYKFEFWYPTPAIFKWRFTAAYWTAILFVLGSLLFTYSAGIGCLTKTLRWSHQSQTMMTTWPNFIGGVSFVLGAYCGYVQLINLPTDDNDRLVFFKVNWRTVLQRAETVSAVGTLAYFVGALLFQVGATLAVLPFELDHTGAVLLDGIPNTIGSALFVAGGACELLHNRMFRAGGATCREAVWWASILNTIGSVFFLSGSAPGVIFSYVDLDESAMELKRMWADVTFFAGSLLFVFSSVLLIVMWRCDDFGLTLLRQLNHAIRAGAVVALQAPASPAQTRAIAGADGRSGHGVHGDLGSRAADAAQIAVRVELSQASGAAEASPLEVQSKPKFSLRGTFFVFVYTWFIFVAIVDVLCKQLWYSNACETSRHLLRHVAEIVTQVFLVLGILLVLALHSVMTRVPAEQPYRAAVLGCRLLGLVGAVAQTATFVDFIVVAPCDRPPPTLPER